MAVEHGLCESYAPDLTVGAALDQQGTLGSSFIATEPWLLHLCKGMNSPIAQGMCRLNGSICKPLEFGRFFLIDGDCVVIT